MRLALLLTAAKWVGALILVVAFFLGPDAIISAVKGGWG